ncbi:MAG: TetR family transcriptional regulator [Streptosporangiaceae bacterium]
MTSRAAILRAARRAFALHPYAVVTLRGIAADAGVSAALIVKHFGGKEQLFEAVADFGPDTDLLFEAPRERLGRHLVEAVLTARRVDNSSPLLRVVFGIGAGDERALLLERFRDQVTDRLEALLGGADAALRAELVLGQLLGLASMLSIHREGAVAAAEIDKVAELYAPGLQALIDA